LGLNKIEIDEIGFWGLGFGVWGLGMNKIEIDEIGFWGLGFGVWE